MGVLIFVTSNRSSTKSDRNLTSISRFTIRIVLVKQAVDNLLQVGGSSNQSQPEQSAVSRSLYKIRAIHLCLLPTNTIPAADGLKWA
jgi:hypothetical protein